MRRGTRRIGGRWLLAALLCLWLATGAHAQLARSYYNVTGIKTTRLGNAVQILIQTDGNVSFDLETAGLFSIVNTFQIVPGPPTYELRLRLNGARIKVPTFNQIGSYPADSVVVGLGNEPLKQPYSVLRSRFNGGGVEPFDPTLPRVDAVVRFYVPITVRFESISQGENRGEPLPLGPREARIELTPDRRAIQITAVLDRVEAERGERNLKRSPAAEHRHQLTVDGAGDRLQIVALHTPLSALLDAVGRAAGVTLIAQQEAADVDVSLHLPRTGVDELLKALNRGYGLATLARPAADGGGFLVGRTGATLATEAIPLKHLTPATARALLPDFLLPWIRTDEANNALVVTAPPLLVARIRQDMARLDRPRPLVRVSAVAYELSDSRDLGRAVALTAGSTRGRMRVDAAASQIALTVQTGQKAGLSTLLNALESAGSLRLVARPSVAVLSGAKGTLFAGQDRFVPIQVNLFGVLQPQALKLPVGTELGVTPQVGDGGEITLQLQPRFTVVEAVDPVGGLPTVGISTFDTTLRLKPGETALVGSVRSDTLSQRRRPGADARNQQSSALLLLVTATLEPNV